MADDKALKTVELRRKDAQAEMRHYPTIPLSHYPT
jgi:hypothetical protein